MSAGESRDVTEMESIVYRDMDAVGNEPLLGPFNFALGVRTDDPPQDIVVRGGYVEPEPHDRKGRGMSVAPHDPTRLSLRHRPPELGGTGSYPVWCISTRHLGQRLRYRPTSATHAVIEPAYRMTLEEYEQAIADTRAHWTRVIG